MAITRVGNRGTGTGSSGALNVSVTISPTSALLASNLAILNVSSLVATLASVTDSQGNEWQINSSVLAQGLRTTDTITLVFSLVNTTFDWDLEEFAGALSPAWFDKSASATGSGTALTSGTTATLSQSAEVSIAAWAINSTEGSFTPGGSYTAFAIASQAGLGLVGEFLVVAATTAQSPTGTAGTTGTWAGCVATYKAGAAQDEIAGPPPLIHR
jgi:hypothetical protein